MIKEGHIIRSGGPKPLPTHEAAEEMESLVKEMAKQNPTLAYVPRCYYFTQNSLRQKAKRINISHTQFKYFVDMVHQWLAGCLSASKYEFL